MVDESADGQADQWVKPEGGIIHFGFFAGYENLRMGLPKALNELEAAEAVIQVVATIKKRERGREVEWQNVMGTFTVIAQGPRVAPIVESGGHKGVLWPIENFERWWKQALYPRLAWNVYSFRIGRYKKKTPGAPSVHVPEIARAEAALAEQQQITAVEPSPLEVEAEIPQEDALPEGAVEFTTINELRNGLRDFFSARRTQTKQEGKLEATLVIHAEGIHPIEVRIEQPSARAQVVWAYPEGKERFSLVVRQVLENIPNLVAGRGGGHINKLVLHP